MEDDIAISELLEIVFGQKSTIHEAKVAHASVRESLLTEDLSEEMAYILYIRRLIITPLCQERFDKNILEMMSSYECYLTDVMMACFREHEVSQSVFDSFINVIALLKYLNNNILLDTALNLLGLNPDIFMVFYRNVLKKSFLAQGGLHRLLEYIRSHKYLTWNCTLNAFISADGQVIIPVNLPENSPLVGKIEKEIKELSNATKKLRRTKYSDFETARCLAREVVSVTNVELPTLPSKYDLVTRLVESRKKKMDVLNEVQRTGADLLTETSREDSNSNSDAKTQCFSKQRDDVAWCETIIQAVMRHNHSKNTDDAHNEICEKADEVLSHFKNLVTSLNKVLNESDKE